MQKKFALLSLAILFILFLLCTVKACLSADKYYMQGIQFEAQEKYQDAYYNYGKINKWSKIYPLGIYKQAKCAKTIGDNKTAIKKYKKYTSIIQNDVMTPVGLWELGNLYYESAKPKDAMKIFKKLESRYPDNNYTYASFYRIGELLKDKDKQQSVAYLAKYLDYAPIGRFSKNAVQYIEKSGENITSDVKVILAKSLMQNGEYDKALNYLMAAPFDKRWIQEYRIYKAKNDETNAIKTIEEGLKLENNNITEDDIKEAINYYLLKKNTKSDIKNIYEITNIKGSKIHYYIGILYAQSLPDGYNLFSDIYKCNSKYSDIALSEMIYLDYKKGNYMSAINLGNEFYSKYKDKNTAPKALYYTAKSYDKNKDKKQAQSLYKKITDDYGRSYYAFRAFQSLNNNPSFNMISKNELPKIREIKYQFLTNDKEGFYLNKLTAIYQQLTTSK